MAEGWQLRRAGAAMTSRYLSAPPVLNSTTESCGLIEPSVDEPFDRGERGAAFRRGADALVPADREHAVDHRSIGDGQRRAAALADGAQDQEVADRARHAQPVGDRRRVLPRRRLLGALLERADDRRTALGLHRHHPRPRWRLHPADRLHLLERLPHADHAGAAAGRIDDPVGLLPVHLLGELVGHRLLAFDAVRLLQRRHVVPAERPAASRRRRGRRR